MRPALEGLCYLTDLAVSWRDDILARELRLWAVDVEAAAISARAGQREAAADYQRRALARVEQISAIGPRLSAVDAYRVARLSPVVLLHTAIRALSGGDALAAAAACQEALDAIGHVAEQAALAAATETCKWCSNPPAEGDSCCAQCRRSMDANSVAGGPAWACSSHTVVEVDPHGAVRRLPGDAS